MSLRYNKFKIMASLCGSTLACSLELTLRPPKLDLWESPEVGLHMGSFQPLFYER